MSDYMCCLRVDVYGDFAADSSINSEATGLFDSLIVLELCFILPVLKCLYSNSRSVLFGSVSWPNRCWKHSHNWLVFFTVCGCSCFQTLITIPCRNAQSLVLFVFSFILAAYGNKVRCCSHFYRGNKTLWPQCRLNTLLYLTVCRQS